MCPKAQQQSDRHPHNLHNAPVCACFRGAHSQMAGTASTHPVAEHHYRGSLHKSNSVLEQLSRVLHSPSREQRHIHKAGDSAHTDAEDHMHSKIGTCSWRPQPLQPLVCQSPSI